MLQSPISLYFELKNMTALKLAMIMVRIDEQY